MFLFDPKAVVEKMLEVLTPEQRVKWKELTGEPFIRNQFPYRGFGGSPRPND
jgi:hypothetical protein